MQSRDLILQILADRDLEEADRRPLYAYRCTSAEFEGLQQTLRVELGSAVRYGAPGPFVAQAFCLWGAEWWRRNHQGGHWAWEDLLASVGCEDHGPGNPYYRRLCELVATGIRRWKRDLLRVAVGRAFLVTLACEGGLPLKLVLREQARLRHFFQTLLEEIRLFGPAGVPPEELAERVDHLLPRSLRQDVVYKLSGNLVARIWELQAYVGQSETPLRDLDVKRPGWRDGLPLSLEDDVARALLNNLLLDAADVARGGTKRIRWARSLVRSGDSYRIAGELVLPGTMRMEDVTLLWPGVDPVPRRFEIWLERVGMPPAVVAFATQRMSRGDRDVVFALEHLSNYEAEADTVIAAGETRLILRGLSAEADTNVFSGAAALTHLPWVFEATPDGDARFRLVGEGTTSVRSDSALVAVTPNTHIEDEENSAHELGVLGGTDRRLFKVTGAAAFRDSDGNLVRVRTSALSGTEVVEYRADGPTLELGRSRRVCHLGVPAIRAYRAEGISTTVDPAHLQWKPDGVDAGWLRWGAGCIGEGTVRLIEAGSTHWSARLCILPGGARVELQPGPSSSAGALTLRGFGSVDVACVEPADGVELRRGRENDVDVAIEVEAQDPIPTDLQLLVRWPRRGQAGLSVPFPATDARFERDGSGRREEVQEGDPVVALNHLSRVRAVVVAPNRGGGYQVLGSFREEGVPPAHLRSTLLLDLKEMAPGLHEQGLGMLQQAVASRFAFSDAPGAHVRLNIHSNASDLPRRALRVERFDLELRRVGDDSKVRLSTDCVGRLSPESVSALRVEAIPLLSLDTNRVALQPADAPHMWHVPERELEPGPWLIVAWDGEWCRAHPLQWFVPEERSQAQGTRHPLLHLFSGEEIASRRTACERLIQELKRDISHAGWLLVDAQVELTQHLSAATLDLLCALAKDSEAAALAALRAPSENQFVRLWRALETLPFWWRAVPADDWLSAAATYSFGLQGGASALEGVLDPTELAELVRAPFDRSVARVKSELPHLAPVAARATARCFGEPLGADAASLHTAQIRTFLLAQRQPLFTNAFEHVGDMSRYPDLGCVSEIASSSAGVSGADTLWKRAAGSSIDALPFRVYNAPVAAALSALSGRRLSDAEVFSLRSAYELSPWWFGEVFDLTFLVAFGLAGEARIRQQLFD